MTVRRTRLRRAAARSVRAVSSVAAASAADARRDDSAVDLVVAALLARPDLPPLADPVAFVRFLRDSFRSDRYAVSVLRSDLDPADPSCVRFTTLLDHLATGVAPLPQRTAVRVGLVADALSAEREPFDRPRFSADVGEHARIASSFARKGRLLGALARFGRARSVFEVGTAYGMSALFLADALPFDGRVGTVECSHPQLDVSSRVLKEHEPERVVAWAGLSTDVVDRVRENLAPLHLLFHDGAHSRDAYVEDFRAYEPLLAPGAVVLYDDIRWEDGRVSDRPETYEGWRQVVAHPRVRAAVELDDAYGLLLLR